MIKIILFFLCILSFVACKRDFDELADTDQRSVSFKVDTSHCFDNVLSYHDNVYSLGYVKEILPTHHLRLVSYCYDDNGRLVFSQTQYYGQPQDTQVTFRHLQKQMTYSFVFIADIVKYDIEFNCNETWYQLHTQTLSDMYLVALEEDEVPEYNVVLSSEIDLKPQNQIVDILLKPLTWNGFLNYANVTNVDKITGYYSYYRSFFFDSKTQRGKFYRYNYDIIPEPHKDNVMIPITISIANDNMYIYSSITTIDGIQDFSHQIYDNEHTPFVITIDSQTKKIKYEKYY